MIYWIILFPLHFNHRDDICWQEYIDALSEYILRFVNAYYIYMTNLRFCLFHLRYKKWNYVMEMKSVSGRLTAFQWPTGETFKFHVASCVLPAAVSLTELSLSSCFHWYEG